MQNDSAKFKIEFEKRLIKFSLTIINLCKHIRSDRNLWPIADQILRSGTSIGANVIEARASSSKKDYLRYFEIALKSANESKYWLLLIKEATMINQELTDQLLKEVEEISNVIAAGILTMKGRR